MKIPVQWHDAGPVLFLRPAQSTPKTGEWKEALT